MSDPRVTKLAKLLTNYSLEIKPGNQLRILSSPLAFELSLAVYEEAIKAGAHIIFDLYLEETQEILFKYATDEQLQFISPVRKLTVETIDAAVTIDAPANRRMLTGANPARMAMRNRASAELNKRFLERAANKELRWCYTVYPNNASAQDADMSLRDYTEFVYGAGMLNEDDPAAFWRQKGQHQSTLVDWLNGKKSVVLKGSDIDLKLSIDGRTFISADGKENFPDGEIFSGVVENSANGWVRFKYPAINEGQEIIDVQLWFEEGKVIKESAAKNQELLTATLNTDVGARYLGELGIGTNYGITKFTKDMLFDEKIGGTIHLALGNSYPETGGKNTSGIHWDMLCDMAESEITIDGDQFYKNGKPVSE